MNEPTSLSASLTKTRTVSTGLTVCLLASGRFAFSAHDDKQRVIVEMDGDELIQFIREVESIAPLFYSEAFARQQDARREAYDAAHAALAKLHDLDGCP